jgi:hypothetical protein
VPYSCIRCSLVLVALAWPAVQPLDRSVVGDRVRGLTRDSVWTRAGEIPVTFPTHHPQGMVKIGETFFVSSVEIAVRTRRLPQPVDGPDRTAGEGTGHLFKTDRTGELIADLEVGEGTMYHPGGIDYDGRFLWMSVAEYRPNSRSIVYRVDPEKMEAKEIFRFDDHLGAVAFNADDGTLHGVNWGSRRFYRWTLDALGNVTNASAPPHTAGTVNPSHYVDYQDCKYAGRRRMLCTGVAELRGAPGAAPFRLGGIDLVDLTDGRPVHQLPVPLWTIGGRPMTQNPVWIEAREGGLRAYFMPEDDRSTIYIYDVKTPPAPHDRRRMN